MVLQLGIGIKMNAYSFLELDLKPLVYKNGHIDPKVLKFHYTKSQKFGIFLDANGKLDGLFAKINHTKNVCSC